jgi:hypothetical protein
VYENCLDYLPASLLAFAEDSGGDLLCIGTQGTQRGRVYFWNHHYPYFGDDEPSFENVELTFLSESLTGFINQLAADESP